MPDWRQKVVLTKLEEGLTLKEAAAAAGVTHQGVDWWRSRSQSFAEAVRAARAVGEAERKYRLWLRHPFRGKRPPAGKGHGGKPGFSYGRR
jgi:hypothetical protein